MNIFNPLLAFRNPAKQKELELKRYEHEKKIAQSLDRAARMKLARSPKTQAEILYYLAQHDEDNLVRGAVASNDATPYQANPIIAADKSEDVRLALAERLAKLLPDVSQDMQSQLYAYTVDALETLASDEVVKIRIVLAQTLKKELQAPAGIINKLAQDLERQVAEPILRECMAVSDDVLLEILSHHPASWTVEAIAQRKFISASVSDAVVDAKEESAGTMLLGNHNADIKEATLSKIVEQSKVFVSWQRPLAVRAFLPKEVAKKLAEFVDESVKALLIKKTDLNGSISDEISGKFRRDLEQLEEDDQKAMSPEDRVRKLIVDNALNEDILIEALEKRERVFAIVVLAALVRTSRSSMENVIGMGKPKPLVAVCHRAGLSMRTCMRVQQELARIPSKELIYARGGTDYPLEADEIKWQLDFLGLA